MAILKKAGNTNVILHATANATWVIAGNNSVSNVAANGEIVTGGYIRQAWFGSPSGNNGYWTIKRGNTVVAVLDGTDQIDYAGCGFSLGIEADADLTVELSNAGDDEGYIMIEVKKEISGMNANT